MKCLYYISILILWIVTGMIIYGLIRNIRLSKKYQEAITHAMEAHKNFEEAKETYLQLSRMHQQEEEGTDV